MEAEKAALNAVKTAVAAWSDSIAKLDDAIRNGGGDIRALLAEKDRLFAELKKRNAEHDIAYKAAYPDEGGRRRKSRRSRRHRGTRRR
jgi:hypothetical protein